MSQLEKTNVEPLKIGYVMSRFPKLTETFILYEMVAVENAGVEIEVYPLLRAKETDVKIEGASLWNKFVERFKKSAGPIKMHPEAKVYVDRAHFYPFLSLPILFAQLYYFFRKPLHYFGTLYTIVRANLGSANFLIGNLFIFPKAVFFAFHMQHNGISHVHAHFANHPAAVAFIIHRLSGIPYSFTAHGADLQVDQHMLCEKIKESAFTLTISEYNKKFIAEKCGVDLGKKVSVLYCGVDTNFFTPPIDKPQANLGEKFTILTIGTFYEVKGHKFLIEACKILENQGLDFNCFLVGSGPFQDQLNKQVIKSGLENRVIFYGQRNRQEIADLLKKADVLAMPSIPTDNGRREGIPVVIMEAMASGRPVVASNISGIPEIVKDGVNGFLIPPKDPISLAKALTDLYNDESLRVKFGEAGRETVLNQFDLQKNAITLFQMVNKARNS